jgi:prepilin-type N-terminal cleavage/methylation domain-containing protein
MQKHARRIPEQGFSLIELMVVLGIIAIMAAAAIPNFASYLRHYQIRAAISGVTGEIQAARNKAIMKNVNIGVLLVVRSTTTYQWVIEDDQTPPITSRTIPAAMATLLADPAQAAPVKSLPQGITFANTCTGFGGTVTQGFRFNRLGVWCQPGTTGCPAFDASATPLVGNDTTAGSTLCLVQSRTGISRLIRVAPGGRVEAQQ